MQKATGREKKPKTRVLMKGRLRDTTQWIGNDKGSFKLLINHLVLLLTQFLLELLVARGALKALLKLVLDPG